jgi:hypothetical protein
MAINDVTIGVERTKSAATRRRPTRRIIAIGATTLVVAIVALAADVQNSGRQTPEPAMQAAPSADARSITEDLVNRGLVPRQTLQAAPVSRDEIVRDLVNRGLVPAATLNG